jgi:hypothetical protein
MEPPFMMDDFQDVEDTEDLESEAAANRRQFILLLSLFGIPLAVAVVVLLIIISTRNGDRSEIELTNEAVIATNTAIVRQQVAMATGDAATAAAAEQQREIGLTNEAVMATNTAVVAAMVDTATAEAATAQVATRPTRTPTPVIAVTTETPVTEDGGEDGDTGEGGEETVEPTVVAQVTSTRVPPTPTRTRAPGATRGAATTPDTGVGGLGAVFVAAVLVVMVFAARRLRMAA